MDSVIFFFFNDAATTAIYTYLHTLSLHDGRPILPTPGMQPEDLADLCRKAVFLQRQAHTRIVYEVELPEHAVRVSCDRRQMNQALTNLLQNEIGRAHV